MLAQKLVELKEKLFTQAALAEEMVAKSIQAVMEKKESIAKEVIEIDEQKMNTLEIEIEEEAINLLALYQPEAVNLRTIVMIIKINNDLERIGDHAVNIAQSAIRLLTQPQIKPLLEIPRMAEMTCIMLKESLNAFTKNDRELAIKVCKDDSNVDDFLRHITGELLTYVKSDPSTIEAALNVLLLSKNLERIADLATNIAEDTVFASKGDIIKHHAME